MNFEDYDYNMFNEHILIDHKRNHLKDSSPDTSKSDSDGSSGADADDVVVNRPITHHKSLYLTQSMLGSLNETYSHESLEVKSANEIKADLGKERQAKISSETK